MIDRTILSDNELVSSYLNGDMASIEVLINRHKNKVYSYILFNVKKQHLAEDLFQDTFVKVVRSLNKGKYVENGKFISWVMRIARNLIIDHFRKEKNMSTTASGDTKVDVFNSAKLCDENVEDLMIQDQILSEVRFLIDELPDDQREVVLMRLYQDLSFKEIADLTGVSINTALGRMRYALINMRKIIDQRKLVLTKS
jgi:RNA polymerase sigma factor (sigma-70 family)